MHASPHATDATFYRAALLLGLCPLDTVRAWAEDALDAEPSPSAELIDLVLAPRELTAMRSALQPLALSTEPTDVVDRLLTIVADDLASGRRTVDDTIHVFTQMRRLIALPSDVAQTLGDLENAHRLALANVEGSVESVAARVAAWLGAYTSEAVTP